MNKLSIFLLSALLWLPFLGSAQIDTITFAWETVTPPPVPVTSFARSGDRLFAGTDYGLYFSDDVGVNWQQHPDFLQKIASVAADNQGVMVERFVQGQNYPPYSGDAWYYIYRSGDGGNTFDAPIIINAGFFHYGGYGSTRVVKINENTLCYVNYVVGGGQGSGKLNYTQNGGATWGEYAFEMKGSTAKVFAAQDTLVLLRSANLKLVADRFPTTDMTMVQTDTLFFPAGFAEVNLLVFRNDRYFAYTQNELAQSDDFGQTWSVNTFALPAGTKKFSYSDDHFYVQMRQGVFRSGVADAQNFSQVFSSPMLAVSGGNNIAFAKLGNLSVACDFGGLHFSFDGEANWQPPLQGPGGSSGGAVKAGGRFWMSNGIGLWRSDLAVGHWELMTNLDFYQNPSVGIRPSPDTLLIGTRNGLVVFSPDEGATWLGTSNSPTASTIVESDGDMYIISPPVVSKLVGNAWSNKTVPGLTPSSSYSPLLKTWGDTILIIRSVNSTSAARFLSFDAGDSWTSDTLSGWTSGTLYASGNLLLKLPNYSDFLASSDFGESWTHISPLQILHPYYSTPTFTIPGGVATREGGLFFANAQKGLRYTTDIGLHWTVVADVPFSSSVNALPNYSWTDEIPAAASYFIKDEYLYAFSQKHGIFRSPLDGITGNPPPNFDDYGFIKGSIWKDKVPDCQLAPPDTPVDNKVVKAGNSLAYANADGKYSFWLPSGNYEVSTPPALHTEQLCGALVVPNVQVTAGATTEVNFAMHPIPGIYDLKTTLTPMGAIRPGFTSKYKIRVENLGNEAVTGAMLTFVFNENDLTPVSFSPGGTLGAGQITFPLDLPTESNADFEALLQLASTVAIGTIETFTAHASIPNDQTPADNVATLDRQVTGSFDPNDKQVFSENSTTPAAANRLDYLIRFQNTGTDTAFKVVLLDTLDARLDLFSLQMLDASHAYYLKILSSRTLQWTFDNILLPDSTTNEAASHGFVRFSINTLDSLPQGDRIENSAAIYFDFNEPVATNTAVHTVPHFYVFGTTDVTLCAGGTYNGQAYFADATVMDTFPVGFYDSVFVANLTVLPTDSTSLFLDLCAGSASPYSGTVYPAAGEFTEQAVFQNQNGCDSTVIVMLTVHPVHQTTLEIGLCQGTASPLTDSVYWDEGVFSEQAVFQNQYGCDSLVTAQVSVHPNEYIEAWGSLPYGFVYNGIVLTHDTSVVEYDTTEFGCLVTTSLYINVWPSATSELEELVGLKVFPNPTGGDFYIEFALPEAMNLDIHITDLLGRKITVIWPYKPYNAGPYNLPINTAGWGSGLYFLNIKTEAGYISKKIIKL